MVYQAAPGRHAVLDGYHCVDGRVEAYARAPRPTAVGGFRRALVLVLGEHGSPRIDHQRTRLFANDQLAVRFIEEIDLDLCRSGCNGGIDPAAELDVGA